MSMEIDEARIKFPRGLLQPKCGFRFASDSIFLTNFVILKPRMRILDLGCGCGVIGFGALLREVNLDILAIDNDKKMIEFAVENASKFGFEKQIKFVCEDIKTAKLEGLFDCVICNPPYRVGNRGRLSQNILQHNAFYSDEIEVFFEFASKILKQKGYANFIILPELLPKYFAILTKNNLEPKRLQFVHPNSKKPAKLVMLECRKNVASGLKIEAPIIINV